MVDPSKLGAGFYWGELRLNRTNTPKTSWFVKCPERNGHMFLPVPLQDGEVFGDYHMFKEDKIEYIKSYTFKGNMVIRCEVVQV